MTIISSFIEYCIDNEHSKQDIYKMFSDHATKERIYLSKLSLPIIIKETGLSYWYIQRFINGQSISFKSYAKLVKYARNSIAQLV